MKTLTVMVLGWWMVSLATAQEKTVSLDEVFRILAVGNSWTYFHSYSDRYNWQAGSLQEVIVRITHTEVIDGQTYYVFSDLPYDDPPPPYFFLAGKKVRHDGQGCLLERVDGVDQVLYAFPIGIGFDYDIPGYEESVHVGQLAFGRDRLPSFHFSFPGGLGVPDSPWGNIATWVIDFGLFECRLTGKDPATEWTDEGPERESRMRLLSAIIGGRQAWPPPTAITPISWGQVKHVYLQGGQP